MVLFPKIIQIETSIVCNGKCVFCPHKEMERGPDYMEDRLWKKIIDESRGKGIIYRPFLINEPFIDYRMPQIIKYIKQDETAKIEFNSNGHFTPKTDIKALLEGGIDWVRFSVDGFTQDTYTRSGRGGKLENVVANILKFIDERNRQNSKCFIEVRMIDIDVNKHEQQEFVEFWSKYADKATITQLYDWPWSGQTEAFPAPCPKIYEEMYFYVDGKAVLCCWDAYGRGIVGDANVNTVEQIWLGETNQKYRQLLNNGERNKIDLCSRCDAFKNYNFDNWKGY